MLGILVIVSVNVINHVILVVKIVNVEKALILSIYLVNHANRYIDEKGVNKYLIFDSIEKNKELLKKYVDVWNGIIDKIKEISSDECDYEKDYIKIKVNSDDDLPLSKQLEFYNMTITTRSVFEGDGKLYPQVFLDDTLYELNE